MANIENFPPDAGVVPSDETIEVTSVQKVGRLVVTDYETTLGARPILRADRGLSRISREPVVLDPRRAAWQRLRADSRTVVDATSTEVEAQAALRRELDKRMSIIDVNEADS